MRLFFALWPDATIRAQLAQWSDTVQRIAGGRATRSESSHITLAFLGDVAEDRIGVLERIADSVRFEPFEWAIDTIGYWPHNKIVWAGASVVPDALRLLARDLRTGLASAGFAIEARAFVPHATLVRRCSVTADLARYEPIPWTVRGFVLVRSALGTSGGDYRVLGTWPGSSI